MVQAYTLANYRMEDDGQVAILGLVEHIPGPLDQRDFAGLCEKFLADQLFGH